ncbi:hypothetical protein E6O75_ATG03453 [Venturia nashicola]|uniref:Uncharacterized protein n=1 Tax=Venturia nashicola TaxID=86259 RepID=A0A4Z1P4U4_9PEZI|nr:hypothetical protein E6O75_ATG03453 [Venturia nashicola]
MVFAILRGIGETAKIPRVQKHVRDEVLWSEALPRGAARLFGQFSVYFCAIGSRIFSPANHTVIEVEYHERIPQDPSALPDSRLLRKKSGEESYSLMLRRGPIHSSLHGTSQILTNQVPALMM